MTSGACGTGPPELAGGHSLLGPGALAGPGFKLGVRVGERTRPELGRECALADAKTVQRRTVPKKDTDGQRGRKMAAGLSEARTLAQHATG